MKVTKFEKEIKVNAKMSLGLSFLKFKLQIKTQQMDLLSFYCNI